MRTYLITLHNGTELTIKGYGLIHALKAFGIKLKELKNWK